MLSGAQFGSETVGIKGLLVRDSSWVVKHSLQICVSDCRSRGCQYDPGQVPITFVEINHEIISAVILLPSADLRRVVS